LKTKSSTSSKTSLIPAQTYRPTLHRSYYKWETLFYRIVTRGLRYLPKIRRLCKMPPANNFVIDPTKQTMALVVLLKGVNVGGYRTFRPSVLAKGLQRFDVVNVGAAGTFVIRKPVSRTKLRTEIMRRLPFEADVMICHGSDLLRLAAGDPFAGQPFGPNIVRFVSVLAKRRRPSSPFPLNLPSGGRWVLRILTCRERFALGLYRREMKAISYLGQLEKLFGVPATTRNWNTILAIARILKNADTV
jgi:uncharacterized protein (DUF1697 family)